MLAVQKMSPGVHSSRSPTSVRRPALTLKVLHGRRLSLEGCRSWLGWPLERRCVCVEDQERGAEALALMHAGTCGELRPALPLQLPHPHMPHYPHLPQQHQQWSI
jgi:hypothetical protein